jgi:four helix bundle protein
VTTPLSFGVSDYKKLIVWRKAHALALNVHRVAVRIKGSEYASLRSQLMRASMSIPTNIVEGTGQQSRKDFGRFIRFALNSSSELEYHLTVARDIEAISATDSASLLAQTIEVRKMLHGLLKRVLSTPERHRDKSGRSDPKPGTYATETSRPVPFS